MSLKIESLVPGTILNNSELCSIFGCSPQGGMRRSKRTNSLVIVSDETKLYMDRWEGNILHYTGMGQQGNQDLTYMQNKTLNESNSNNVKIFLFEVFKSKEYTFAGEVELVERPYQEQQLDINGSIRDVWIFPIELKESSWHINYEVIEEVEERKDKKARTLSNKELEEKAKLSGKKPSKRNTSEGSVYIRNSYVKEIAHRKANGKCQLCNLDAPFKDKHGKPFLEIHHIEWLSAGGQDSIENTIALCPNCHRKVHLLEDPKDVIKLKERVFSNNRISI